MARSLTHLHQKKFHFSFLQGNIISPSVNEPFTCRQPWTVNWYIKQQSDYTQMRAINLFENSTQIKDFYFANSSSANQLKLTRTSSLIFIYSIYFR